MNALPIPQPPESPTRSRRVRSNYRQNRKHQNRVLAAEATLKIGVNILISSAAIAALTQLLPYSLAQQTKLQEIQTEVKTTSSRVDRLKAEFNRYFDPRQAQAITQEQSHLADPNQKQIVWQDQESAKSAQVP